MILSLIVLFCIMVLTVVVAIHIRKLNEIEAKVTSQVDAAAKKYDGQIKQLLSRKMNLLDMAEFKDMDGYMKETYKKYIVDAIMASFNKKLNAIAKKANLQELLTKNSKELDNAVAQIIAQIEQMPIDMSQAPKK